VPWPLWVYRGPPEVYRGPCMKNMAWNRPITYTHQYELLTVFAAVSLPLHTCGIQKKFLLALLADLPQV